VSSTGDSGAGDESPVFRDAARLLGHRLRSSAELRQRLRDKGYADHVVEPCLARLARAGFLDDQRFAVAYVRDGVNLQRRGAARLRRELQGKGVADELIDAALELVLPAEREAALAEELVAKYAARVRGLPPFKARQKLAGYLQRRGLTMESIWPVLDRFGGDDGGAGEW
jgi:regulatory protein